MFVINRKHNEKDFNERLENYNQKFTYAMQSFQSTVGNLSTRLNEQKDLVINVTIISIWATSLNFFFNSIIFIVLLYIHIVFVSVYLFLVRLFAIFISSLVKYCFFERILFIITYFSNVYKILKQINIMKIKSRKFVNRRDLEDLSKNNEILQANINKIESKHNSTRESLKTLTNIQEQQVIKLKETSDGLYDLKNVQIPTINTRLNEFSTREDFNKFKTETDQKVDIKNFFFVA